MHPSLAHLEHRPWPLPKGRWTWRQNWYDLAFLHWPVPAARLAGLVPRGLTIQEFDGSSWVGAVPFRMAGVMRRPFPDLPWFSAFAELNVRLYVEFQGRPGVWFLSLDATNALGVWGGRRFFHLPYHRAEIQMARHDRAIEFHSRRRDNSGASFKASYAPQGPRFTARPGTLEHFLTERYCLYAARRDGTLVRCEVHHAPWPLERAEGQVRAEPLLAAAGLPIAGQPPLMHCSPGVEVVIWPLQVVGRTGGC